VGYLKQSLSLAERNLILRALEKTGWVKKEAAKLLGITRTTLYRKLKQYKIQLERSVLKR